MKILLISVGVTKDEFVRSLAERYCNRIGRYMPFEAMTIPDVPTTKASNPQQRTQREGELILSKLNSGDFVILMDEGGRQLTSREFAEFIDKKTSVLSRNLVFIIGGPYGFSDEVYSRADMKISLSAMTFTHEMAKMLTCEQLYRAMTILRGEPYHHD